MHRYCLFLYYCCLVCVHTYITGLRKDFTLISKTIGKRVSHGGFQLLKSHEAHEPKTIDSDKHTHTHTHTRTQHTQKVLSILAVCIALYISR